jgi:hypothetical protein
MSKYKLIETDIASKEALIAVLAELCEQMNFKIHYHAEPVNLRGFEGDIRPEQANIVIDRRYLGNLSNDIGWLQNPDGTWTAIVSEFDMRQHRCRQIVDAVAWDVNVHQTLDAAKEQGYTVLSMERNAAGRVTDVVLDYA